MKSKHTIPGRYHENSQGDFYVENGVCTSCGAPQAEAPDLIDHSKLEYGHCYFKKQPETDEEIERAINAIAVSCISGLRYGGTIPTRLSYLFLSTPKRTLLGRKVINGFNSGTCSAGLI